MVTSSSFEPILALTAQAVPPPTDVKSTSAPPARLLTRVPLATSGYTPLAKRARTSFPCNICSSSPDTPRFSAPRFSMSNDTAVAAEIVVRIPTRALIVSCMVQSHLSLAPFTEPHRFHLYSCDFLVLFFSSLFLVSSQDVNRLVTHHVRQ